MIKRMLQASLIKDAQKVPAIALIGPRQSGKTTLARATFPGHTYISLEELDVRSFATTDPRGFLAQYEQAQGIILDEIQHAPGLLSYIQTKIDLNYKPGFFVLTGSQNFLIHAAISQTLAGRISFHTLLPLSIEELSQAKLLDAKPESALYTGFYPRIFDQKYNPTEWYEDYIRTYVERDVRTITNVGDLSQFRRFIQLCSGRIGQLLNLTSLGNDCGISYQTAKSWLSILEASYIVFLLQPHHANFNKRLVKMPKLYFYDCGLAATLLGIESAEQLHTHYLRGGLFESMIISDLFKNFYNRDKTPHLYFWRDKTGHELDCLIERGTQLTPIEIKSGKTINDDYFDGIRYWNNLANAAPENAYIIYAGDENQKRTAGNIISWKNLQEIIKS